jgi:glycosyltransferase involved in cell wall biosynthesis
MTGGDTGSPPSVSVLMSIYAGVAPAHVEEALDSVSAQTSGYRELVVVVDGPVTAAHEEVLARRSDVKLVRLPENLGTGLALAAGMRHCSSEWVACADADDICDPRRLETQLQRRSVADADVCSAAMSEFVGSPDNVVGVRSTPEDHSTYARLMATRNPVNQPAVVFRRSLAEVAGGYQHLPYHEDYDLWARMLRAGAVFTGCREPLVLFRADGFSERRTRPEAIAAEREQQRRLRVYGIIGPVRARLNLAMRTTYLRLPPRLMDVAYRRIFHR